MLDRILARVSTVKPGRAVATAVLFPFYLFGLLVGGVVMVVVVIWAAGVEGYRQFRPVREK